MQIQQKIQGIIMMMKNPELEGVSDHEVVVRIGILLAVVDIGIDDNDPRIHRPLSQIQTLLNELMARHPNSEDQIVRLSTLDMQGERPPLSS